jgi:hypothetical protein
MFAQASWYLANLDNLEVIKLISQVGIKTYSLGFQCLLQFTFATPVPSAFIFSHVYVELCFFLWVYLSTMQPHMLLLLEEAFWDYGGVLQWMILASMFVLTGDQGFCEWRDQASSVFVRHGCDVAKLFG